MVISLLPKRNCYKYVNIFLKYNNKGTQKNKYLCRAGKFGGVTKLMLGKRTISD